MELGVGNGPQIRLKGFRNINKKTFGTVSINSTLRQSVLTAGLQGSKIIVSFGTFFIKKTFIRGSLWK